MCYLNFHFNWILYIKFVNQLCRNVTRKCIQFAFVMYVLFAFDMYVSMKLYKTGSVMFSRLMKNIHGEKCLISVFKIYTK